MKAESGLKNPTRNVDNEGSFTLWAELSCTTLNTPFITTKSYILANGSKS